MLFHGFNKAGGPVQFMCEAISTSPSGKKYDAGNGQDIRPGHQVEVEENSGRIIVSDSNRRPE